MLGTQFMSRKNPRLRDWPECLVRLSVAELERELRHWRNKVQFLGSPVARKGAAKRVREVERELATRSDSVN
jgi:hypothetical protein